MYKFLIGPALMGAGYVAGSVYGSDAEQLVHRSPAITYAIVEQALDNVGPRGTTFFDGGTPMPYEFKIDRVADQKLTVSLSFNGQPGARAELDFIEKNGGRDTLLVTKIHGNRSILAAALAGTDKAKLAYAPDWMLNIAVRPLLQKLATQIEQEGSAGDVMQAWTPEQADAQWEANLSAEQRQEVSEAQQYYATRPALDLDSNGQ